MFVPINKQFFERIAQLKVDFFAIAQWLLRNMAPLTSLGKWPDLSKG